jgi:biotin transport system substrate-specific component
MPMLDFFSALAPVSRLSRARSQAWLESLLPRESRGVRALTFVAVPVGGALLLALLAQIAIPLPWTPVPITGQTFGVAALALLFGARMGGASIFLYLGAGALGAPVLAGGARATAMGGSFGYLVGMALATLVVGTLADRGWTRGFWRSLAAAYCGSAVTFACGILVLSAYVPARHLLAAGLWPFLFGDAIKNALAAAIASRAYAQRPR